MRGRERTAMVRNRASVASNSVTTFSILFFCCEMAVASSSLSSVHSLPPCPFSPVEALAALVESPSQRSAE